MEWDEYGNPLPFGEQRNQPREWDEQGRPVQQRAPARQQRPPNYTEAQGAAANLASGATLGLNDEITGAIGGSLDALRGGSYSEGYQREAQRTRDVRDQFLRDRYLAANALQGTGAALPIFLTQGRSGLPGAAQQGARVAAPGLVRRSAEAATMGAGYGYATAFGSADGGSLDERLLAANEGAARGAILGGAIPPAFSASRHLAQSLGRPSWEAAANAARRIPVPDPNSVGAMGRPWRPNQPPPPQTPGSRGVPGVVGGAWERLADRSRQTPDQVESRLREYRLNPQGQVLADAFDQPGVQTLRSMTQSPGQTGSRAAEVARERFQAAPERILTELNRRMAVAETPEQAMASLRSQYERVSAENYRPVFERQMTRDQRQNLEQRLNPFQDDPVFRAAIRDAEEIFARDRRLGLVEGQIEDNFARYMHYVKMGLDDAVAAAPVGSRGLQSTQMRGVYAMRQRVLQAIDDNVPGYRDARAQWGGLVEAEEALAQGGRMINHTNGAIRDQMASMSPFARYHARVGFANEVANRVGLRGSANGNRNVAEVLGSPEMQRRVAAMFDSPDEAAAFLDTLNQQNMLMRNAQGWNGGSSTAANLAHADDNASNALEAGIDLAQGRRTSAVSRLRNIVTGGAQERANNQVGESLLRRVDNDADFARQVVEELRRRERERFLQSQAGNAGGAAAGSTGN